MTVPLSSMELFRLLYHIVLVLLTLLPTALFSAASGSCFFSKKAQMNRLSTTCSAPYRRHIVRDKLVNIVQLRIFFCCWKLEENKTGRNLKQLKTELKGKFGGVLHIKGELLYSFLGFLFWFWTPIEQLNTTDWTIKSVDLQKAVTRALSLPCIFCILSKRSVLVNNSSHFPSSAHASTLSCTHNPFTDTK